MKKPAEEIKILIIEDDQPKREEMVEILRDKGIKLSNVFTAGYAEKGIEILENELPDIVLLDLKIPYNEESISIKTENSNKVIREVERLNAIRNLENLSTGIIIISASVADEGVRNNYKHTPEVVDFFDKDEIAINKEKFISDLFKKIQQTIERDFKHECKIELKEIRNTKLSRLKKIHQNLYERITIDLLEQFEKLNNKNANISHIAESIIGLSGRIVEDIINLIEDDAYELVATDRADNYRSVREKLTFLTGRSYDYDKKNYTKIGNSIFSRKSAHYATLAYKLRSEALHSKEGDSKNDKIFVNSRYTIEDAAISINLIMPLIQEFIEYKKNK